MTTLEEKVNDIILYCDVENLPEEERNKIEKYMAIARIQVLDQVLCSHPNDTTRRWKNKIETWLNDCVNLYRSLYMGL